MEKLAWHFDFHSHKSIRINHDPDVESMAAELAAGHVDEIITFAKCHTGFAYYPSKVGNPHPRMVGDAFGDVVAACKAAGVRVLAYISFGIDGEAGRRHPEWAQVGNPEHGPHITEDHFIAMCPYTPYVDEFMLPMIQEIIDDYEVDGFFFDTMGAMGICHCECCRAEFARKHAREIPRGPDSPDWGRYGAFRRERAWDVVGRVGGYITDQHPETKVGFNWVGTTRYPERMPEGVTCLTCDYSTTGPQSLQASFHAAYGKTADRPCDVMYTILNRGWADWAPRPLPGLEQTGVTVWAHGCRPYLGDRLHPTNRLDPMSVRAIRFMGRVQEALEAWFPPEEAEQPDEILVVIGPLGMYGTDMHRFACDVSASVPAEGTHRLLLDAGYPMAITAEAFLGPNLAKATVAVLPEIEAIHARTEVMLKAFVEAGGRLLVMGRIPRVDGKPLDWLGVTREKTPWQDHIYLPVWTDDPEKSPVLVQGDFHRTEAADAEVVQWAIQPYDCSPGMRFGHATGPAAFACSEVPALIRRRIGKGETWYLEANMGTCYRTVANYWQADWFRALLSRLIPTPSARVVSAAGTVEITVHTTPGSLWAILINHGGEQLCFGSHTARTFAPVPPYPVRLEVTIPAGKNASGVTCDGQALEHTVEGSVLRIPVVMDRIWRIVRIDWA